MNEHTNLVRLEFRMGGEFLMTNLREEVQRFGGRVDTPWFVRSIFVYVPSIVLTDLNERVAAVHRLIQEHLDKGGDPGEDWINTCLAKVDFTLLKYDQKSFVTEAEITAETADPMHLKGREFESIKPQVLVDFASFEREIAAKMFGAFALDKNGLTPDKKGP